MSHWLDGRVVERIDWTDALHSLRIEAPIEPFRAGQFIKIGLEIDGKVLGRPYSLVNPPDRQPLEVYFMTVPEGPLTPRLAALKENDRILVAPHANGFMVIDEVPHATTLWLIATGTGIAPFLSILSTEQAWDRFETIVLVHAVRNIREHTYRDQILAIAEHRTQRFHYIPFASRESADHVLAGRVPQAITDGRLEARAGLSLDPAHSHVMLCGNPAMIDDTMAALTARGLKKHRRRDPGHISVESYW